MRRAPYWTLLTALFLAFLVIVYALLYGHEEPQPKPIKNAYYPFTVEVEIWDIGASPWDNRERPTDLDKARSK